MLWAVNPLFANSIDKFKGDGQDLNKILDDFEAVMVTSGIPSETKVKFLPCFLDGYAKKLYQMYIQPGTDFNLAISFLRRHFDPNPDFYKQKFHNRKLLPGEKLASLLDDLQSLANKAFSGHDLIIFRQKEMKRKFLECILAELRHIVKCQI
jgi:hypothetical protein